MTPTAEWLEKDYYAALGVPETATEKEITRAYRRLARQLHPDANPDGGDTDRFREVAEAYDVLHDAERRRQYDEVRRLGRTGRPRVSAGTGPAAGSRSYRIHVEHAPGGGFDASSGTGFAGFGDDDLADLFGGMFQRGPTRPRPVRGGDLTAEVRLGFEEAVRGTTKPVAVDVEHACPTCGGAGGNPWQGTVCPDCAGEGVVRVTRSVTARIPPGVDDGQTVRLAGRGAAGSNGGPPGDVLVTVRVAPHPVFTRRGRDLAVTVPVTFAEAALGAEVRVPTLDDPVTVRIPPGTQPGTTLRVRGRGIRAGRHRGDLLVTVQLSVPTRLTDRQRAAVEALAAATDDDPRATLGV